LIITTKRNTGRARGKGKKISAKSELEDVARKHDRRLLVYAGCRVM